MGRYQSQQRTVQQSQSSQKKQKTKRGYTTYLDIAIAIVAHGLQTALEVEDDCFIEAIATLGPIEGDGGDRTVFFDEELFRHLCRLYWCCFTSGQGCGASDNIFTGLRAGDRC